MMSKSAAVRRPGAVPPVPTPARGAATTGETVVVACKMPNGLVIRGFRESKRTVPVLGGGHRDERYYEPTGEQITIFGNARAVGGEYRTRVVAGFALTQGVSKRLWDEWVAANADLPAVKNGLIFAYPSIAAAADESKVRRKLLSGLEPLNPEGDPRRQRPLRQEISEITTRDDVRHDFETVDEEA